MNNIRLSTLATSALLWASFLGAAEGTTIVVLAGSEEIVIAGDSKVAHYWEEGRVLSTETTCKIREFDGVVFSCAGTVEALEEGFDIWERAGEAVAFSENINEQVGFFEILVCTKVQGMLNKLPANDERSLTYDSEELFLEAVFACFNSGRMHLFVRRFVPKVGSDGSVKVEVQREDWKPSDGATRVILGASKLSKSRYDEAKEVFLKKGRVVAARELVELEINEHPHDVGPPIDILQITADGVVWIQRKKDCE